ncbi:MAG: hypothetical protein ISR65_07250 [Bacteriovoracaceae bacterium]|nr:hypothetical protein [Bacteriovoracaceae bacterium]
MINRDHILRLYFVIGLLVGVAFSNDLRAQSKEASPNSLDDELNQTLKVFRELDSNQIKEMMFANSKGQPYEQYLKKNPKILDFAVRVMQDKSAIPSVLKISRDKTRLIYFGLTILGTIIFGYVAFDASKKKRNAFGRILYGLKKFLILTTLRFIAFCGFFYKDLTPIWNIFVDVLLK